MRENQNRALDAARAVLEAERAERIAELERRAAEVAALRAELAAMAGLREEMAALQTALAALRAENAELRQQAFVDPDHHTPAAANGEHVLAVVNGHGSDRAEDATAARPGAAPIAVPIRPAPVEPPVPAGGNGQLRPPASGSGDGVRLNPPVDTPATVTRLPSRPDLKSLGHRLRSLQRAAATRH
jgi:hypothetical protein